MQQPLKTTVLAYALVPRISARADAVLDAVLIVGFAALTGLAAQVSVYLNPAVPITGQTFAVLMTGAVLGSKRGAASMLVYLGTGVAGVPVFAPDGPISGSSRGYILGFVAAAFIVGLMVERGWGRNPLKLAAAMLAGEVAIYAFGLPWLAFYIPAAKLYDWGLKEFIIGDAIKLVLAASGVPLAWAGIRRLKGEDGQ